MGPVTVRSTTSSPRGVCPYCGTPLRPILSPFDRSVVVAYAGCGCERAQEAARAAETERMAYESSEREQALIRRLRASGMPRRYEGVEPDSTYLADVERGGLFVHGPVGRGKTHLAVATMRAWAERHGGRVVFTDANSLLSHVRDGYNRGGSEREAMWRYIGCPLLVFDDFGKGKPSEWALERVEDLVNERYNAMRPTIYTSQWRGRELLSRLALGGSEESAEAIVSRILETCRTVELKGPDRRIQDRRNSR